MSEVSTGPELSAVEVAALAKRGDTVSQRRFVGVHILLLLGGVLMVFPFVYQILMSLSTNMEIQSVPPKFIPDRWQFHNYTEVFTRLPFLKQFGVSVTITVLRTVVQLILCSMGGYAFARMKFGGKSVLFGLVLAILMVPGSRISSASTGSFANWDCWRRHGASSFLASSRLSECFLCGSPS